MGIFPDRESITRLVGAVLAEQHDEWAEGRRYLGLDAITRARTKINNPAGVNDPTDTKINSGIGDGRGLPELEATAA